MAALKKQDQYEGLPPTRAALLAAILRAHYETIVWYNYEVANPRYGYGCDLVDGHFKPVMISLHPAPGAVW